MKEAGRPTKTTKQVETDLTLRKQAEKMVQDMPHEPLQLDDAKLLHELRVHEIELEMQNDELRNARHQLELSRERYFELYDLAPVGYLTISPEGLILESNLTAASMLGLEKREMLNKEFQRVIYHEDQDSYLVHRNQLVECLIAQSCELRCVRADSSSPFWAHLHAIVADNGEYRVTLIDIDQRKLAEESLMVKSLQLEELNQSLEKRIAQAVKELRQKDELLIQQGRMAAMGEMINNIAHQWRQPLNNIGLIVQSLRLTFKAGTLTAETMNKDIANTMQLLQQMSATIDDFRNFFSQKKDLQTFTINDAVKRSLNFMLPSLKNSNIVVRCDEQPDVHAEGYPGEYTQATLNILTNAKDVLLERKIEVPCIDIRIFSENGRSVLTVTDNGGGIPKKVLPKIFDPYFTTRANGAGTGIGLFMSKMIVEKNMQGRLTASNTESGAEFRIEL